MMKRKLGQYGPIVSAVGIGAMSFTNFYGPTNEQQSHAVLKKALDLDIDHIDTSNVYGMGLSETVIGNFLSSQGKQKDQLFKIATKAAISVDTETKKRSINNSKLHLETELHNSLDRLGVDCVDLYYIHRRDPEIPIEEVTQSLADFVKDGKIKSFGFSEIAPSSLRRASQVHPVAAIQSEYSLAVRSPELGLVQTTRELGTSLVAFSPVGRGILTDAPHSKDDISKLNFLRQNPRFQEPNLTNNVKITDGFRAIAKDMNTSAAALAIAWVLQASENVIAIPGTRSTKHLEQLAKGAELKLTIDDIRQIEKVLPIGWAHGDRYSQEQWIGPERYC